MRRATSSWRHIGLQMAMAMLLFIGVGAVRLAAQDKAIGSTRPRLRHGLGAR